MQNLWFCYRDTRIHTFISALSILIHIHVLFISANDVRPWVHREDSHTCHMLLTYEDSLSVFLIYLNYFILFFFYNIIYTQTVILLNFLSRGYVFCISNFFSQILSWSIFFPCIIEHGRIRVCVCMVDYRFTHISTQCFFVFGYKSTSRRKLTHAFLFGIFFPVIWLSTVRVWHEAVI